MSTIVVALKDIITDEANPVDLSSLPVEEAAQRIRDIYGFLSKSVEVTIREGVATITLDEARAQQANQALKTLRQASEQAARGKFKRAVPLYQEVLRVLPDHTQARRELAMALMETESYAAAKKHLIRVLQLDPNDAWAYLILGNLYFHAEQDWGSADRYYTSALELAPDDPYILTSAAGLKAVRGDYAAAEPMFIQAIERDPTYPNARHGLALCYANQRRTEEALGVLAQLFAQPESEDPRRASVYEQARELFREIHRRRAEENHEENLAELQGVMGAYSARTGVPIDLRRDEGLATTAKLELAWRYDRR